jgi:RNA polymerase sigma-70 factor (ECF subfamily)
VYRIARNLVIDHYRRRKMHISLDDAIESEDEAGGAMGGGTDDGEQIRLIDMGVEADKVLEAMKQMKADYREVLMLKYIEELSISEIAEIVGKSQVHVRVLLHRATKTLGTLIGGTQMEKKI